MLLLPLVMTVALVTDNQTALRAAPHETAPRQAVLWEGDWLEVRGERQGFLQVYDHRRERPGYVHPWQVRTYPLDESSAPALRAVLDYLKAGPGHESLGIGYAALYLRVAPPALVDADLFASLGLIADRLAQRASTLVAGRNDLTTAAYLEVAESYGVHFHSFDAGGHTRVCYDGEAERRVLALVAAAPQKNGASVQAADAALSLTDPACVDPALPLVQIEALVHWQAGVTADAVKVAAPALTDEHRAALTIRRAVVLAQLAYQEQRHDHADQAAAAGAEAMKLIAGVDRAQLSDDLDGAWQEAGVRVNVVRWATDAPVKPRARDVQVALEPGTPGQTCIVVRSPHTDELRHCTFGVVWPSSVRIAPAGNAVTVAVQPLPSWSELVLLQRNKKEHPAPKADVYEWTAEVMTPSTVDPDLGYVEQAGWSPDGAHLLVVREFRVPAPGSGIRRRFQILTTASQVVEKEASTLANFPSFRRWQSPDWTGSTLALR